MIGLYLALGQLQAPVQFVLGLAAFLAAVTGTLEVTAGRWPRPRFEEISARLVTWWVLLAVFAGAVVLWPPGLILFALVMSLWGLREFFAMMPYRMADRRIYALAFLAVGFQYLWVALDWYGMFIIFVPLYCLLLVAQQVTFLEQPQGAFATLGRVQLGLLWVVFCLSHAAYLLVLPGGGPSSEGLGLLCFVVVITELGDVGQYVFGKVFGRTRVLPVVSPNKTLAGVFGGVLVSVGLAVWWGPWLTPLSTGMSAWMGVLIGLGGFVGDAAMSGLKRELGVKDTSAALPGHGGVLDRIDSLLFTAPLFFHVVRYVHY